MERSQLKVRSGIAIQASAKADYWVQLGNLSAFYNVGCGKALIETAVAGKSTRHQERLVRLEKVASAKALAEANDRAGGRLARAESA